MVTSIQDPEIDRLARELSEITGESPIEAILHSLEERLERERHNSSRQSPAVDIRRIQERLRQLPVLDSRNVDELIGYDTDGLPR